MKTAPALLLSCAALVVPSLAQVRATQALQASDPEPFERFGGAADVDGSFLAVGDEVDSGKGAVYVFRSVGGRWTECQKLQPSDLPSSPSPRFGSVVRIIGDHLFCSATFADGAVPGSGAVYVYRTEGETWALRQKLYSVDGQWNTRFGATLDSDGTTLMIGAPLEATPEGPDRGRVHVFSLDASNWWRERQVLRAPDAVDHSLFGLQLSVDGDWAVVGQSGDSDRAPSAGAGYLLRQQDGQGWAVVDKFYAPVPSQTGEFGYRVCLRGDDMMFSHGSVFRGAFSVPDSVHFYKRNEASANGWVHVGQLSPGGTPLHDDFGKAIVIDEEMALIGARQDGSVASSAGAAYIYRRHGTGWTESDVIVNGQALAGESAGVAVALDGSTAVVGASGSHVAGNPAGRAYTYDVSLGHVFCPGPSNSTGAPGDLFVIGSASYGRPLVVEAGHLPVGEVAVAAASLRRGTTPNPFGGLGVLCLGQPMASRGQQVLLVGPSGRTRAQIELEVVAGETWHFQVWYRDRAAGASGASNLTHAVALPMLN